MTGGPSAAPAAARDAAPPARAGQGARLLRVAACIPGIAWVWLTDRDALPDHTARALTRLGPVFVKVAQVLSTRRDLLPEPWIRALASLRSQVRPCPPEEMAPHLAAHLDRSAFAALGETPIAAGAVAQVYVGRLHSGERVAVKVLRPGIDQAIRDNLDLIQGVVRLLCWLSPRLRILNVGAIVAELRALLEQQTDLDRERRHYHAFRALGDRDLVIPRVHDTLCSSTVLVTELVEAITPEDHARLSLVPSRLAARLDAVVERMVFVHGICHADLHPGNFFWNRRGQVVLVDLGLVYELSPEERIQVATFCLAFVDGYHAFAVRYFLDRFTEPVTSGIQVDRGRAADEMLSALRAQVLETGGTPDFARFFYAITSCLLDHRLKPRPRTFSVTMTTAALDGYIRDLDPAFDTLAATRRKRAEEREALALTAAAEAMIFGQGGAFTAGCFEGPDDDLAAAHARRDAQALDALQLTAGARVLHVDCGRGHVLARARARGLEPVGIAMTQGALQACRDQGLPCVPAAWEALQLVDDGALARADGAILLEPFATITHPHELAAGLTAEKAQRLLGWLAGRLNAGARVFLQCMTVEPGLVEDPLPGAPDLRGDLPDLGLMTLPALEAAAASWFVVKARWDRPQDLPPFLRAVEANLEAFMTALTSGLLVPDAVRVGREQVRRARALAEAGKLCVSRWVLELR